MNVSVKNGTNAGWKRVRARATDWVCPACGNRLRHFWLACPNDNTRRPDSEEE